MFSLTSPVTGASQTGFTSPTYTLVSDVAPSSAGKQYAITALGGTQVGVTPHSVSSPFTVMFARPQSYKVLGQPNPVTGRLPNVPSNTHSCITRKGVTPMSGQPPKPMIIRTTIDTPAGAETYDSANVRAALSLHIAALVQASAGIGDTCVTGTL